jgi:cytosine/adenosine deaminase-related metal-dependent hydrolase
MSPRPPARHLAPLLALIATAGASACSCSRSSDDPDVDGGTDEVEVELCASDIEPVSGAICAARGGDGPAVLIRGDVLGADRVYAGGEVLYAGDQIICAGCDCSGAAEHAGALRVECPDAVISPGLINPHDHLSFTEGAPLSSGLTRYDHRHGWRGEVPTPGNAHGSGADSAGMRWGEVRMLLSGVTSLVGSGRANNLIRNLDQLAPAERDRGFAPVRFETFPLGDSGEQFRADCGWSYRLDELEAADEPAFLPHVAEGIDNYAAEEFRCQSSSFDGEDFTESNATHIHSIGLSATDYYKMASDRTRLLWSPRSNISLYGHTAAVTLFDNLGGTIALGTDWTYSGSANMLRELACADQLNRDYYDGHFTDRDLWEMATINAAIATGNDAMIGSLAEGKIADIAVFAAEPGSYYRGVLEAENADVALVVQSGRPMLGETDILAALGASCDPVDVCGEARSICVSREVGVSFADLAAEVAGGSRPAYSAIFCGVPANEPTCVPFRNGEFTGELTADDPDGDGLTGAADNCPNLFNPPRPIDGGQQPDADGDGVGDVCDATPFVADLDEDGVPDDEDNCRFEPNSEQVDSDGDGKGDVCDFCPTVANPEGVCAEAPPTTVSVVDVQTGEVAPGTRVGLEGLVVTAIWSSGLYAQDPTAGTEHSGLHIFTGAAPGVAVGDEIDAVGTVSEFFGETQIDGATINKTGDGTPIAPVELTAAEAADEKYEGVLVTVTDVGAIVSPYDCSEDHEDCADPLLWEVNGMVIVFNRAYQGADWEDHMGGDAPVTGVMGFRFERRRILPRTAGDF